MELRRVLWLLAILCVAVRASAESVMVISDTHMTADTAAYTETMDAVRQAASGCGTGLFLGDNTNNGRTEEHIAVTAFARSIAQTAGAEVLMIPGNHDYTSGFGRQEFAREYAAFGWERSFSRDGATASCAVMSAGGTCFLLLDTNQLGPTSRVLPDGGITQETLAWLDGVLSSLPEGTPVVACGHHPILPAERSRRTPGADGLADTLRAHGVRLYLCGHDHGFATVEENGLRQITVGQPHAYPGWAGTLEISPEGFRWQTEALYDTASDYFAGMERSARDLGIRMARGTLQGTSCEGDEAAVGWFASAFTRYVSGELTPDVCAGLLADESCAKWRGIETKTVVRDWIISLLEHCPEDVRQISLMIAK